MLIKYIFTFVILFSILILPLFSFSVEIFQWIDEEGTIHFTDDPSKISKEGSGNVKKIEVPRELSKDEDKRYKSTENSEREKNYLKDIEKRIRAKKDLEKRVSELEEDLKLCEDRLKEIEEYEKLYYLYYQPIRDKKTGKWIPVASPYFEEKRWLKNKVEVIKMEIKDLEQELEKTKGKF